MNMIQYFGTGIGLFAIGKISAYAADRYLIHHTNLGRFTVVQIENFPLAFFLCSSPWRLGPDSPIFQIPAYSNCGENWVDRLRDYCGVAL